MRIAISLLLFMGSLLSKDYAYFIPPPAWEMADPSINKPMTQATFISQTHPGSSIHLSTQPWEGSLKDYIAEVKADFANDPNTRWRDIGPYKASGLEGRLVEMEMKTAVGDRRALQLLTVQGSVAYVVTTSAFKSDFALLAPTFKKVLQSFSCTPDPLSALNDKTKRTALEKAISAFQTNEKKIESPEVALRKVVLEDFSEMGALWQIAVLQMARDTLKE